MIRQIIKLIWNRKKNMSLLLIEIFMSFIVAFIVCDLLISSIINYTSPLGYNYKNLWDVRFEATKGEPFGKLGAENATKYRLLLSEIKSFPEVRQAGFVIGNIPYGNMRFNNTFGSNGSPIYTGVSYVGDDYLETMQMSLVEGRWFDNQDNGAVVEPIVIDETLKRKIFGDNRAVGEHIEDMAAEEQNKKEVKYNIIGVVTTFRPRGELNEPEGELFMRQLWDDSSSTPYAAMVRVQDGTTAAFELNLQRRLSSLAPDINFRIVPLSEARQDKLLEIGLTILLPLFIAAFLLFNVALGLFGIFWQSISRRRSEIGLRRAMGADSRKIPFQIWGETMALGTFAMLAGIPIVVNLAVLGLSRPFGSGVFFLSIVSAGGLIYLILTVCAVYPSLLAARIQPAEALHDE
ncbi:putative Macrolide export ATP-binding/permease protein macB 1/2 [Candidatus Zixiibacteriota bacterium]|nr:putative Macrolide export ATP-binding/permease protein macB 1/2 [candidate division Zixibacteria bacterium]